jgi:hypothetical protein
VEVSTEVVDWLEAMREHLAGASERPVESARERMAWMSSVGEAFSEYRAAVYAGGFSGTTPLGIASVADFCGDARRMLDLEIEGQRRDDDLYHAYNLLEIDGGAATVHGLHEMLEGQVAALSSGAVGAEEAVRLVDEMFDGPLHRKDLDSFLLYPERELPAFLDRNVVPEPGVRAVPLLREMLRAGDARLLTRDVDGVHRFHADFANARDVEAALDRLERSESWGNRAATDRDAVLRLYESVFRHRSFTGRSGTMYGYEGLGCVYWHMVAKLLLAVQEIALRADLDGEPADVRGDLANAYYRIREGLGFRKSAEDYGAFPTDPYSHTPAHGGARQPGMTGQVKEEILTRLGELGVRVRDGVIRFRPILLRRSELLSGPRDFPFQDPREGAGTLNVPAGGLAFTFCQVPVVYREGVAARIRVTRRDGREVEIAGDTVSPEISGEIFGRTGEVLRIDVEVPEDLLLPPDHRSAD